MAHPVPAAKTALKALLAARGAWSPVDIRDGQPTEQEDVTRDAFWFDLTEVPRDGWASLGAQTRRIHFSLGFTIAVLREADSERTTEDVTWTYYEDLMAVIKANPTLSGTVQQVEDISGRQLNEPAPGMWRSVFSGAIACQSKAY